MMLILCKVFKCILFAHQRAPVQFHVNNVHVHTHLYLCVFCGGHFSGRPMQAPVTTFHAATAIYSANKCAPKGYEYLCILNRFISVFNFVLAMFSFAQLFQNCECASAMRHVRRF